MDERSQQLVSRGIAITLAILYISLFVIAIWKYVSTGDMTNSTWEIILIVMIPASIAWFARKDESLIIPKMMSGENIPTDSDGPSKRIRKRHYFLDSFSFALVVLMLNLLTTLFVDKDWQNLQLIPGLNETMNLIVLLLVEFIISILVFYGISYLWEELSIKKYNRRLAELEDNNE